MAVAIALTESLGTMITGDHFGKLLIGVDWCRENQGHGYRETRVAGVHSYTVLAASDGMRVAYPARSEPTTETGPAGCRCRLRAAGTHT